MEIQAAFEELDAVVRIFDLGEIESHLNGLDRLDPVSMVEVYLILAYHHDRISGSQKPRPYFQKAISLANNDPNFEDRPFYETYEAILYHLIAEYSDYREDILDARVRIAFLDARTKIQKYVVCDTWVSGLLLGYKGIDIDFLEKSLPYCPEEEGLAYLSYVGAAQQGANLKSPFSDRIRFYRALRSIALDKSQYAYARLEAGLAFFAGPMDIESYEFALLGALNFQQLLIEFELEGTPLHFISLLGMAIVKNRWGDVFGYQKFLAEAERILSFSENPAKFFDELSTEVLVIPLANGVGENYALETLSRRWTEFEKNYTGHRAELGVWSNGIKYLAYDLYFEKKLESRAVELLESFIKMHDQAPAEYESYIISNDYSEDSIKLFEALNELTTNFFKRPEFDVKAYIYDIHFLLADLEKFRDQDDRAVHHYKLAWERMPKNLKSESTQSIEILRELLNVFAKNDNRHETVKIAYRILDNVERILFSSDGPYVVKRYENSSEMRYGVETALFELWFEYGRASDENSTQTEVLKSEMFRALQILRVNRLTKFHKTIKRETALKDILEFKEYRELTQALEPDIRPLDLDGRIGSKETDRNYTLFNLENLQSKIPLDTVVIAAYDTGSSTNFAEISSFWFNPFASIINSEELSKHMNLTVDSSKNTGPLSQFNFESASWIYANIFKQENSELLADYIKNIIFLPSKSMFNFPISLLHNGTKKESNNVSITDEYDTNGFLIDDYYISYAVDFSDDMFGGSDGSFLNAASYKPVTSDSFFALADPYLGNQEVSALRGITYVDVAQPNLENLAFKSLPETLAEVNAAAEYFIKSNVNILSGEVATKENMLSSQALNSDVLMFSTHGVSPGVIPGYEGSGLLLSLPNTPSENFSFEDVLLTPDDVLGLNLDADIVILNACNSGLSDVANAPGLTGLAQSFLAAGSDAVMVSHWPISSATTVQITKRMFEIIKQDPKTSFNRALTDAQLSIKADPKTQNPFYWAPYNIYGNF